MKNNPIILHLMIELVFLLPLEGLLGTIFTFNIHITFHEDCICTITQKNIVPKINLICSM